MNQNSEIDEYIVSLERALALMTDAAERAAFRSLKEGTYDCKLCQGPWMGALGWRHGKHCHITIAKEEVNKARAIKQQRIDAATMAIYI